MMSVASDREIRGGILHAFIVGDIVGNMADCRPEQTRHAFFVTTRMLETMVIRNTKHNA